MISDLIGYGRLLFAYLPGRKNNKIIKYRP